MRCKLLLHLTKQMLVQAGNLYVGLLKIVQLVMRELKQMTSDHGRSSNDVGVAGTMSSLYVHFTLNMPACRNSTCVQPDRCLPPVLGKMLYGLTPVSNCALSPPACTTKHPQITMLAGLHAECRLGGTCYSPLASHCTKQLACQ